MSEWREMCKVLENQAVDATYDVQAAAACSQKLGVSRAYQRLFCCLVTLGLS